MAFQKTQESKYIIGFDLRDDYCQMSYMEHARRGPQREPITYAPAPDSETFSIPTSICKKNGVNRWYCGQEAVQASSDGSATYIPGLLGLALDGAPVQVESERYEAAALLALFIRRCLMQMKDIFSWEQMESIMFTCRTMDRQMIELLETVKPKLELPHGCSVFYEGYASSYYHYLLMQDSGLRFPASLLCEYENGGQLRIGRMKFNQKTKPVVAYMEEKVYPGLFAMDPDGKDREFASILSDEIRKPHDYASAYLIGGGFQGGWMKESVKILCSGRRAFLGSNLYSKGAVYSAQIRLDQPDIVRSCYFLDSNHIKTNIGIRAVKQGTNLVVPLLDAGVNWYEASAEQDIIIEDGNDLYLQLTPLTGGNATDFLIRLEGLTMRPGRAARIRMKLSMNGPEKAHVFLEDLGFGEIFPSSGLKWEQEVTLG